MIRSTLSTLTKQNLGPRAAAHLHKAALDDVGGAQFAPQVPGESEERQQLRQVLLQPPDHSGGGSAPARAESAKGGYGLRPALSQIDRLGSGLHFVVVALPRFLWNVPHLVHPAALMPHPRIDRANHRRQTRAAAGENQAG